MEDLDELRAYLPDYLRQRGVRVNKAFRCLSPEHEDKHPSMHYNPKTQRVHCFACGVTYDLFDLIGMDYRLSSFPEQVQTARSLFTGQRPEAGPAQPKAKAPKEWRRDGADGGSLVLPEGNGRLDYFTSRGIPEDLCRKYGLFQTQDRAYLPLYDENGRCAAWCARALREDLEPRYKNSPGPMPLFFSGQRPRESQDRPRAGAEPDGAELESDAALPRAGADGCVVGSSAASRPRAGAEPDGAESEWDAALSRAGADGCVVGSSAPSRPRAGAEPDRAESEWDAALSRAGADGCVVDGFAEPCAPVRPASRGSLVYVVEGMLDALSLEAAGRRAVALCGGQNGRKLLDWADAHPEEAEATRFLLCGDPDDAGRRMNAFLLEGLTRRGLRASAAQLPEGQDLNDLLQSGQEALEAFLTRLEEQAGENQEMEQPGPSRAAESGSGAFPEEPPPYETRSSEAYLDEFFAEASRRGRDGALSTGFDSLDELLDGGLHPELYVLGAISSLGKTSFLLQLADNLAWRGTDVLFFSLEQSRFELTAKSLSRESALLDHGSRRRAFTARELMTGRAAGMDPALLIRTRERYQAMGRHLFLTEGVADIGAAEIREAVRRHVAARGTRPVVMVDYLQILRPSDPRATDKQNTDRSVVELKRLSRDYGVPVLAVSSFNRENYRAAVSMEAFKESGAVEYSSDVLFGMQLAGAGEPGFDVNAVKLRDPRPVELVLLKNRSGLPYAKLRFDYHPRFSLFEENI